MVFRIASSPYTHNQRQTSRIMMLVLLAALPGIAAQLWFFGWGTLFQIVLAAISAIAAEAGVLKLRKQPIVAILKTTLRYSLGCFWPSVFRPRAMVDGGIRHGICGYHCETAVWRARAEPV